MADQTVNQFLTATLPLAANTIIPIVPPANYGNQPSSPQAMQTPLSSILTDSGWQNMVGFSWMSTPPQYRVIGRTMYFRGSLVVPLNTGSTTPTSYSSESSYSNSFYVTPAQGGVAGANAGVVVNGNGNVTFNLGSPVLQSADISAGNLPDTVYTMKGIGLRRVAANATSGNGCLVYSGYYSVIISTTGTLILQTFLDLENGGGVLPDSSFLGTSALRFVNSKVTTGDHAIDYRIINSNGSLHGATSGSQTIIVPEASTNPTHSVTLDAMDPTTIGGFNIDINGLVAYLDPLTTH